MATPFPGHMTSRQEGRIGLKEMPEEFMRSYCYRVVVERIISAMKNVFGVVVRLRRRHNRDVEAMSMFVVWN